MKPMFPRPKDIRREPEVVRKVYRNGVLVREQCNLLTKAGMEEYRRRVRVMWERQGKRCCLEGRAPGCPGRLAWSDAMFEHEDGRGMGGGSRDDRIEKPDKDGVMRPYNGAAHPQCNTWKGSQRISYNADAALVP